jgi:hypothetical protein
MSGKILATVTVVIAVALVLLRRREGVVESGGRRQSRSSLDYASRRVDEAATH